MVGLVENKCLLTSLKEIINKERGINKELMNISKIISNY